MSYTHPSPTEIAARRAALAGTDGWNERALCALFALWGIPDTYLDLGSGTGAMVNMARRIGVDAYGVDVINGPEHWFVTADLTRPLDLTLRAGMPESFALVTCLEVAEHLPERAADTLVATIASHLRVPGGRLIFSAAPPGQGGEHHVNLQPAQYWRDKLYTLGISYRADYTRALHHLWTWTTGPLSWLPANVQVFDT